MVWIWLILANVLLALIFGGIYGFFRACRHGKCVNWLDEQQAKKYHWGRFYQQILDSDQWLREQNAQDVQITSDDGLTLKGKWIPAKNPKGTVIMAHGYHSTMLIDCHLGFELFHRLGWNILAPHQRSHGESQGRYITFGVKESRDMARWVAYHNSHISTGPVVLFGISMGASTMLYLADKSLPDNVKAIIADCGFTSPAEIIASVFQDVIHVPPGPILWVTNACARLVAGFGLWEQDTRKTLANSRLPVLLIHGTGDDFVPCSMTQQAYDACTSPRELLLVEGAEHGMSYVKDAFAYTKTVIEFLKKYAQ